MAQREAKPLKELMVYANERGCLLMRNNSGGLQAADGRWVYYGLGNDGKGRSIGSSDLIGPLPVLITQELVGRTLGIMVCVEVKVPGDPRSKPSPDQLTFIAGMRTAGCLAGIVRTPADIDALLRI